MARLPVGYRLLSNGLFECRFSIDKKRYSCYGKSIAETREKERELRQQIEDGLYTKNKNITLDKYFNEWIKNKELTSKGNTILNIKCRYENHIKKPLGHRKIVDIEKREIIKLQKDLSEKMKASSVNVVISWLKAILNDAVADEIIVKNPVKGVKNLKIEKKATETHHRALTEKEQDIFLKEAKSEWLYELIALLLCTGMRIGEATALTWQDIDTKNNVIHVTKTISRTKDGQYTIGTPKSDSSIREIPLTAAIKDILQSQKYKQELVHGNIVKMNRPIFENIYGKMVFNASVNKAITDTLKRVNKEKIVIEHFSAHALRHTFATRFLESGGSLKTLQVILGHTSFAMTSDLYSHVLPTTKQKEMDNLKIVI